MSDVIAVSEEETRQVVLKEMRTIRDSINRLALMYEHASDDSERVDFLNELICGTWIPMSLDEWACELNEHIDRITLDVA